MKQENQKIKELCEARFEEIVKANTDEVDQVLILGEKYTIIPAMMSGYLLALSHLGERAEDMWDKYSEHIDDNSFGFNQVAGTSVITRSQFIKAFNHKA